MRSKLLLSLVAVLLLGIFLINQINFRDIRKGNDSSACTPISRTDEALLSSLYLYEKWISQYKDYTWVYVRQRGYPMYLYSFGIMYARLYQLTCDSHYLREFLRIADGIERIRNYDWTWSFFDGTKFSTHRDAESSLYNAMFAELFTEAYKLTNNVKYKKWTDATIRKIEDTLPSHRTYNYYFLPFTSIAYYCSTFSCDKALIMLGKRLYNHALSGCDPETGRWYYNPFEKNREFYDGHTAFYQMGQIAWFLDKSSAISENFPYEYYLFSDFLTNTPMVRTVIEYMLPSGTFFYSEDVPDYTESAGDTLYAFARLARFLGEDYGEIIRAARETILTRQAPQGGFYKTPMEPTLELWFGDNIAINIARYLYLLANVESSITEERRRLK